jgi:transmembrane sensor
MTSPSADPSLAVLERYIAGLCEPTEAALVEQWVAADAEHARTLTDLREILNVAATRLTVDVPALFQSTMDMIEREKVAERSPTKIIPMRATLRARARSAAISAGSGDTEARLSIGPRPAVKIAAWYAIAATAMIGVGIATLVTAVKWNRARHQAVATTYTTRNGERANITLSDGSTVVLNVASRLDVPGDYLTGNRALHLTGEALFTVAHHAGQPFRVIVGQDTTRDVGTTFLVRRYPTDRTTTVAVREGEVAVRSVIVSAAQQADVNATDVRVSLVDSAQFSFASGVLTITGGLLPDVLPELDRWYDAEIRLGDPGLATRRLTGQYANGSLADLAAILEMTFDVRVVRTGRTLTLYSK